jgi:hypothetical protein
MSQESDYHKINSSVVNQPFGSYPGRFKFKVSFEPQKKVTKNMAWTYSEEVKKLYVSPNTKCPFKVSTEIEPPSGSYLVCIPVYKDAVSRSENVQRCPYHCKNSVNKTHSLKDDFWMECTHTQTIYHEDVENHKRHCLAIPYEKSHSYNKSYTYHFQFMCRNTCIGGINRRATEVVFPLKSSSGLELGRRVVDVKVCACPGRDRRNDEESACYMRTTNEKNAEPDEEMFTITIRGRSNYMILKTVAKGLEMSSSKNQ